MTETKAARLLIVDDHELVRSGLQAMLSGEAELEIVGEAADGREVVELCERVRPDLVLMDVRMPEMDGLAATRAVKHRFPNVVVLILTVHENKDYMMEAIEAGASGYVLKDAPREELVASIQKALDGETILSQNLATQLLRHLIHETRAHGEPPLDTKERARVLRSLTPRELEVLEHLALGHSNPQIACSLFVSAGTVKNHVEHVLDKLEVSDRTQAVVRAIKLRIVDISKL